MSGLQKGSEIRPPSVQPRHNYCVSNYEVMAGSILMEEAARRQGGDRLLEVPFMSQASTGTLFSPAERKEITR